MEAFDWQHGVFMGSGMGAETTAAATVRVGVKRRDPMAMLPFCGYHMGDYFAHWLAMGKRLRKPPKIFRVNWFRVDDEGKFLWPGYGENIRVLEWILHRVQGRGEARETPIGFLPTPQAINVENLSLKPGALDELTAVDTEGWLNAVRELREYYQQFGERLPSEIRDELERLDERLHHIGSPMRPVPEGVA